MLEQAERIRVAAEVEVMQSGERRGSWLRCCLMRGSVRNTRDSSPGGAEDGGGGGHVRYIGHIRLALYCTE
jgi:hypothetical protein